MQINRFWTLLKGARPLMGTIVGVGIFGLPYAFAQVGYPLGVIEMLLVCALNLVALFLYADLVLLNNHHGRFLQILAKDLGVPGQALGAIAFFGSHFGALIAYTLVGGSLAHTVFSPLLGGEAFVYQLVFWLLGSLFMVGGLFFVVKVQTYILPLFFILVLVLLALAIPSIDASNLTIVHPENAFLPLGVMLFSFGGLSSIPEIRDLLGKEKRSLRSSIVLGSGLVAVLYLLFTTIIVGVSGDGTTQEAVESLMSVSPVAVYIASVFGMVAVFSAFMTIGVSMTNTLFYDGKFSYYKAWLIVVGIPLVFFLIGARDFIGVIGFTGGVLASLTGMLLIVAYERARMSHELPKRALNVPQWLVALSFVMFAGMFILTIAELLR